MEESKDGTNKYVKVYQDLVGLFDTKPRAAATVGLILVILFLGYKVLDLQNQRIQDQKDFNAAIVAEVRKQVQPAINDIKEKQDSNKNKIDSTAAQIAPVLESVKKALKKFE